MFRSLRTRIWVSFSILFGVMLCVVMLAVGVALRNSPLFYRSTILRLRVAEAIVANRLEEQLNLQNFRLESFLQQQADSRQIRLRLLQPDGSVIFDSALNGQTNLPRLTPPLVPNADDTTQTYTLKDARGYTWFYTLRSLVNGDFLMAALQRPRIALRTLLRDELWRPFIRTGLVAVILTFLVSLWVSRWVTLPLRKLAASTHKMGEGEFDEVSAEGPSEVRELVADFNRMAARLKASQQSQREFLANISHELKTPLTSIQGFAQAIQDGTSSTPEDNQRAAAIIFGEASRMHRLVLDLLTLTRLESGTTEIEHQPVNLGAVLQNVVQKFTIQVQQAGIKLEPALPELPAVTGDGDRLAQVFTNLVDNAVKFTPAGGIVRISASVDAASITVTVADTGPGISPADQPYIFDRFFQVDKSRKGGASKGVGLGLAIARQIVLAHGGKIWVVSEPGQGSQFCVQLPLNGANTLPTPSRKVS